MKTANQVKTFLNKNKRSHSLPSFKNDTNKNCARQLWRFLDNEKYKICRFGKKMQKVGRHNFCD